MVDVDEEQIRQIENTYDSWLYVFLIIAAVLGAFLTMLLVFSENPFLWIYGDSIWPGAFRNSTFLIYLGVATMVFLLALALLRNTRFLTAAQFILAIFNKNRYFILLLLLISILLFNLQITVFYGDNWAGHMARVITGVCRGEGVYRDWYLYHLKYYGSNILSAYLNYAAAKIGSYFNQNTFFSLAKLSNLSGVLFIFISGLFVRKYYRNNQLSVFALLFLTPSIILFLGYIEAITTGMIFSLLYFYFAYRYLQLKQGIFWPALFLSMAMLSHMSQSWLIPSLVYLIQVGNVSKNGWSIRINKNLIKNALISTIALALPFIFAYSYIQLDLKLHDMPFSVFDLGFGTFSLNSRPYVPLTEQDSLAMGMKYTMFSFRHALEYLSLLFRVFSFYFILLILFMLLYLGNRLNNIKLNRSGDRRFIFLMLACGLNFIFIFIWPMTMMPPWRGVDPFSLTVIPLSLFIVFLVYDVTPSQKTKISILLLIVALLFIGPWIAFNLASTGHGIGSVRGSMGSTETALIDKNLKPIEAMDIARGQTLNFLFLQLTGFIKNKEGQYDAEAYFYLQNVSSGQIIKREKLELSLNTLIKDMNNRYSKRFGTIDSLVITLNTSSFPAGAYDCLLEIKDPVSGAQQFAAGNFVLRDPAESAIIENK